MGSPVSQGHGGLDLPPARQLQTLTSPELDFEPAQTEPNKLKVACEIIAPAEDHNREQSEFCTAEITKQYAPPYWSFGNISALGQRRHNAFVNGLIDAGIKPSMIVPHITWGGKDEEDIRKRLILYGDEGIERVIVSPPHSPNREGYRSYGHKDPLSALPLMRLVKDVGYLSVGLSVYTEGHPKSRSRDSFEDEFERVEDELRLADFIVTKPVFRTSPVTRLAKLLRQASIVAPITPGIMAFKDPVVGQELAGKYNAKFYTRTLKAMIQAAQAKARKQSRDSEPEERILATASALNNVGEEFTAQVGLRLAAHTGSDTLHLYTGNHSRTSIRTLARLGVTDGGTF